MGIRFCNLPMGFALCYTLKSTVEEDIWHRILVRDMDGHSFDHFVASVSERRKCCV